MSHKKNRYFIRLIVFNALSFYTFFLVLLPLFKMGAISANHFNLIEAQQIGGFNLLIGFIVGIPYCVGAPFFAILTGLGLNSMVAASIIFVVVLSFYNFIFWK